MYIHETISFFFALNYSQEKLVTVCLIRKINVCQKRVKLKKTRNAGLIRNTPKDCNIQVYLITMNLKTKQPIGKF